ncbi:MAG: hemerythrin family protein [Lachnospiraceae bacterium]|nr:hemerythrin family protein [Lachnospiraceae bacterium]
MTNELIWNNDFNIGVDVIDNAHQKLFSIVQRIMKLVNENKNQQLACAEGIKFFKNYTAQHFSEEEAYMRSINYPGYAMHKKLHDNLRDKTLPTLEQNLKDTDYSTESIERFLGICIGWLTGHIMIEDKAITGKTVSKWDITQAESVNKALKDAFIQVIWEIFGLKSKIFSEYYGGESFSRTVNYILYYISPEGKPLWVILSMEEKMILETIGKVLGFKVDKINNTILSATKLMAQQILHRIGVYFQLKEGAYSLKKDLLITDDAMKQIFAKRNPQYSLLLHTDAGCLALCIKER